MPQLTVDALLLDSDGVLVDSHDLVRRGWSRLADEFGLDLAALTPDMAGVPASQTLAGHLDGERLAAAVARLEDLEVALVAGTPAVPGAVSLLTSLPAERVAIVTSASRRLALRRWAAAGIPTPPTVITADDVHNGKPDPEPYLAGAAALGWNPARCLVVEDSRAGGESAVAAGASVLAVGPVPWEVQPVARVADLTQVSVVVEESSLRVTIVQSSATNHE